MIKFKFIHRDFWGDEETLREDFKTVDVPLPYKNLPDGEYLIRGNKKNHRKKYYKVADTWFIVQDRTTDNGQYDCDSTEYELFPSLPQKEWDKIEQAGYKRLNKVWKRHLAGYLFWLRLREIRRNVHLSYLQYNKVKL